MADFEQAFKYLLPFEGGYSNDPDDRGEATKYGISLRWYKSTVDRYATADDIRAIDRERAENLYRRYYWSLDRMESQRVANSVFALVVHTGHKAAYRVLQQALNYGGANLAVDGIYGRLTEGAANRAPERELLPDFRLHTLRHYQTIMSRNPSMEKYRKGWTRRALS